MDLRNLPESLSSHERCAVRRMAMQQHLEVNLSLLGTEPNRIGEAEKKNCEQMFGSVPIPVGYAGPLNVTFSSGETRYVHLPLATTEGALVASVNRGCKAISKSGSSSRGEGSVHVTSNYHGITRSIALKTNDADALIALIKEEEDDWKRAAEATSNHLKVMHYSIEHSGDIVFLKIHGDSSNAMGMNMITIAAREVGSYLTSRSDAELITVAANIDSDKKPSKMTHSEGRGFEVIAQLELKSDAIADVLKTTPEKLLEVAHAKLETGSEIAGALGANLHVANVVAALYLATGQDAAHVVEGSLADTKVTQEAHNVTIQTRLPAVLVGILGGGTTLPAQAQCLEMLLKPETTLKPTRQLAESIGAAVLAGEISLLAAQAAGHLAKSHQKMAR